MSVSRAARAVVILLLVAAADVPAAFGHADHRQIIDLTFPTVAGAEFHDDYDADRGGGRRHRGIDLYAPAATPVFAAVGGTVSWLPGRHPSAGYALHIRGGDGRVYAYYHLGPDAGPPQSAYAPGMAEGASVARGQLIGFVGDSGNAVGSRAHLHFEIHDDNVADPYGTNRINPHPSLLSAVQRGDYPAAATPASLAGPAGSALRLGDRGPGVADWQRQLNLTRSAPVAADGIFGPQTDQATREFQQARGIAVDGIVGPQTWGAIAPLLARAVVKAGDRGPGVADWQRQLNLTRSAPVAADGIFGPQTDQATREFQQARGIAVDGIVGPQTWRAALGA